MLPTRCKLGPYNFQLINYGTTANHCIALYMLRYAIALGQCGFTGMNISAFDFDHICGAGLRDIFCFCFCGRICSRVCGRASDTNVYQRIPRWMVAIIDVAVVMSGPARVRVGRRFRGPAMATALLCGKP